MATLSRKTLSVARRRPATPRRRATSTAVHRRVHRRHGELSGRAPHRALSTVGGGGGGAEVQQGIMFTFPPAVDESLRMMSTAVPSADKLTIGEVLRAERKRDARSRTEPSSSSQFTFPVDPGRELYVDRETPLGCVVADMAEKNI
eukprot:COSAG06_NODE_2493_length_6765_cov_3.175668_1_plen_145_part_10